MGGAPRDSHYIHGTEPSEQERLLMMNRLVNAPALRELALAGGESILDLGCGLAGLTRAMARAAGPGARVLGIERSAEQLAEALRQAAAAGEAELVELRPGDALAPPLAEAEWGSFDVVHARFLLEHLQNPLDAVKVMMRAARPGGRLILQDDDHALLTLHPEPAGFTTLWTAYMRSYDRVGNDPYIGRRLVALLHAAGARPGRATLINFGASAGDPLFDTWCENLARIFSGARELVLREALCDSATWDAGVAALQEWRERPDAAAWYGVCWAEGVKA